MINELYFVPESPLFLEVNEKYRKLRGQLDNYIASINFKEWTGTLGDMSEADAVQQKLAVPILRKMEDDTVKADAKPTGPAGKQSTVGHKTEAGLLRSNFNVPLLRVINEVNYWNKIQSLGMVNMPHSIVRLLTENEVLRKSRENVMTVVRLYNNI